MIGLNEVKGVEITTELTVDGWALKETSIKKYRRNGIASFKRYRKMHPELEWEFRFYNAVISKAENDVCTDWRKEDGWSIWFK